jgi:hypothetical protein
MPRTISITRRRTNLVDLNVRRRAGVSGFEFSAATSFGTAFSVFQTISNDGMQVLDTGTPPRSVNVPIPGSQHRGMTRFVFDPTVYTATIPAIVDSAPFAIRIRPVLAAGGFGPYEEMCMVLPYDQMPSQRPVNSIYLELFPLDVYVDPGVPVGVGEVFSCAELIDKSVQVGGTFFATVEVQGTLDGTTWEVLGTVSSPEVVEIPNAFRSVRLSTTSWRSGAPTAVLSGRYR